MTPFFVNAVHGIYVLNQLFQLLISQNLTLLFRRPYPCEALLNVEICNTVEYPQEVAVLHNRDFFCNFLLVYRRVAQTILLKAQFAHALANFYGSEVYIFLFGDGAAFLPGFSLTLHIRVFGKDDRFRASMFVLHVSIKCSLRSVGLAAALGTNVVFGDFLIFASMYSIHTN